MICPNCKSNQLDESKVRPIIYEKKKWHYFYRYCSLCSFLWIRGVDRKLKHLHDNLPEEVISIIRKRILILETTCPSRIKEELEVT